MAYAAKPISTDDEVRMCGAIDAAEDDSYGGDTDGQLSAERARSVDLYLGRNLEPAPDGRSQVRDRSVYETVQGMMPSLSRIFANGDDVVELPPIGPEDEETSKQEAEFLNHVLLQKNNWFEIFDTAGKDALLTKAGYLHPYVEKRRQVELERYENQTQESLALIMQDGPEVISIKEKPDPDGQPQPMMQMGQPVLDPMTGQPVMGPPPNLYDVEIRRTKEDKVYCIDVFPPERCKIAQSTKTVQLRECSYFEFYDYPTISELRQMGYEIDDETADEFEETLEDTARDQYSENRSDINPGDPSMKRVKCRWIWIRHDFDEDGIAELQYVVRVGQKVLFREEVNRIPVAVLCPDKLPHRHVGLCPADTVADIQQIKTAILRQGLDNLYLSNNPRTFVVPGMVNLDDVLISRPGGAIRGKNGAIFGQHIAPLATPFVFPQAMEGLGYMDQVKEQRTGVSNYFTGLDQNALNKTATGIQQLSTMAAQRVEQIARHFANGIEELCSILHEVILKSGHKADTVKLRGQWVTVDPSTWRRRTDFRISVGFAAGNKDALMGRLMMIAQMQEKAMLGGLSFITEENVYETFNEIVKASDMQAPARFSTDPSQVPPKGPPQPDVTVMAMETLKANSAQTIKAAELKSEKELTAAKLMAEREKAELQSQTALTIEQMKQAHSADVEVYKSGHQLKLKDKDREIAATNADESGGAKKAVKLEQELSSAHKQMQGAFEDFQKAISGIVSSGRRIVRKNGKVDHAEIVGPDGNVIARRHIERDEKGKSTGVHTVGADGNVIASHKIKRGKDGRAEGVE